MKIAYFKRKIASLCYDEENVPQVQVAVDVPAGLKHTAMLCRCAGGGLHLSTHYSWRRLCQQQHIHLSMAALCITIYRNLFRHWYLIYDKNYLFIETQLCASRLQCAP